MRLEQLAVKGFRSFRDVEFAFAPINLLIGANGSGKSNFLSFFRFMQRLAKGELRHHVQDQGGPDKILHFGLKKTRDLWLRVTFDVGEYEATFSANSAGELRLTNELSLLRDSDGKRTLVDFIGVGSESNLANDRLNPVVAKIRTGIENWRVYHFHDTTATAGVKQTSAVADNVALHSDASNLAAFLLRIRNTAHYELIVRTVRQVAPFFNDFVLEPEDSAGRFVRLRWSHRGTDRVFDAFELSDGTLRFICLATVLLQPVVPGVIVLDEPELGLHPYALSILAGLIRALPPSTQIVAATQSVTLANQFDLGDIVVVDRHDESTSLRRPSLDELNAWLGEYGIGDLWEKNVLGGTPR